METLSWKCFALIAIAMCSLAMAVPVPQDSLDELSPIVAEVSKSFTRKLFIYFIFCHE